MMDDLDFDSLMDDFKAAPAPDIRRTMDPLPADAPEGVRQAEMALRGMPHKFYEGARSWGEHFEKRYPEMDKVRAFMLGSYYMGSSVYQHVFSLGKTPREARSVANSARELCLAVGISDNYRDRQGLPRLDGDHQ